MTGAGAILRCSPRERTDLFEAALAGQGQCAIITRAVLRAVAAPVMVREYALRYPDAESLLAAESALLRDRRFDGVVGLVMPSESGWTFALLADARIHASRVAGRCRAYGGARRAWNAGARRRLRRIRRRARGSSVWTAERSARFARRGFGSAEVSERDASAFARRRPGGRPGYARVHLESGVFYAAAVPRAERRAGRIHRYAASGCVGSTGDQSAAGWQSRVVRSESRARAERCTDGVRSISSAPIGGCTTGMRGVHWSRQSSAMIPQTCSRPVRICLDEQFGRAKGACGRGTPEPQA